MIKKLQNKQSKKLALQRETIRPLDADDLRVVGGGAEGEEAVEDDAVAAAGKSARGLVHRQSRKCWWEC